jgi:hypothetical protein
MDTLMFVMRVGAPFVMFATGVMVLWRRVYPGRDGGGAVSRVAAGLMAAFLMVYGVWLMATRLPIG